jgi:phage head maturation protease
VKGNLLLDLQKGKEAHTLLKSGVIEGLSIGFIPKKTHRENDVRILDKVDLLEVSLVTFMANPQARVTTCKGYDSTIRLMNRLRALKNAINHTDWKIKNLITESFI